jgi:hypothetical protein
MNRRAFIYNALCLTGCSVLSVASEAAASLGTIVYVQKDGLWLRELPAGTPRLLVGGPNLAMPRFSPSGKWISYFDANWLYVFPLADKYPSFIGFANEEEPLAQWLPQRDVLVLDSKDGASFYSAENSWKEAIRQCKGVELPLLFSADGEEFVYAEDSSAVNPDESEDSRQGRLCRMSVRDSQQGAQVLLAKKWVYPVPYAWNAQRKELLYWLDEDFSSSIRCDGLKLAAISDGGGPERVFEIQTLVYDDVLSLSPDRQWLAASAGGFRETWESKRIVLVNLETKATRYLTGKVTTSATPRWSPMGDRIAYALGPAADEGGGDEARRLLAQRRLWSIDPTPGSMPRQLTHDPLYRDEEPMWSAGGNHILFGRVTRYGHKSLWLMRADGTQLRQVTGTLPIYDGPVGAAWRAEESWAGYYGYLDWHKAFDWRQPA